jgi:hypothetical protein
MSKEIDNLKADKNGLNEMVEELQKKIKSAAVEAEVAKAAHEKEVFDNAFKYKISQEGLVTAQAKVQK